jgi:site-specific DNA-methyltransferase (adenine-specific)
MAGRGFGGKNQPMINPKTSSIHKGDCLELMKEIPDGSIDMILCDLPYGTTACKWDTIIPFDPLWAQYKRIIKDNGAVVLTASQPFTSALVMSNPNMFRYSLVWDKKGTTGFQTAKIMPLRRHEDVIVFYSAKPTYIPAMVTRGKPRRKGGSKVDNGCYGQLRSKESFNNTYYPTSVIEISNASKMGLIHPTQKPVPLFEYLIKTYTNEDETVLDNCAGSFTTAIACLNTDRKYICMEQDGEYFSLGENRITEWHKAAAENIFKSK